ncbi:hypothetical protein [Amycolatopsis sp. cg13]|uniref:hypothetical protein n=1 Tax=Amycolatopsis sp. cg13 TaxID=3238807 RepID=UPI0035245DEF
MAVQSAAPWSLPPRPLPFVNRDSEIARIQDIRAGKAGEGVLLQLAGARGMGKTLLAVHAAYELREHYPDGGVFLDARGSDPQGMVPAADLARQLLVQLGVPYAEIPGAPADRLAVARGTAAGKRLLIVLDDLKAAEQLDGLLGDVSQAAVLVTSRGKLDALRFRGFSRVALDPFDRQATAKLVNAFAGDPHAVAESVIDALWRKCAGLPLALAVGASRVVGGDDDPQAFVDDLALADLEQGGELSVRGVFDAIYQDLDEDRQRDYRVLSLVPGTDFGVPVAAEVLRCSPKDARNRLAGLSQACLLENRRAGRYGFHQLIREHAQELAHKEASDDSQEARERSVFWLAARAMALDSAYAARKTPEPVRMLSFAAEPYSGSAEEAAQEFDLEWDNVVAAARMCADLGRADLAAAVPTALYSFGYQTGRAAELVDLYTRALDFDNTPAVRWQLHRDLAGLYEDLCEGEESLSHARAAAESGHAPGTASALEWLGLACERLGRAEEARGYFRQALAAVPLMGDSHDESRARALLSMHEGRVAFKQGQLDEARPAATAARDYFVAHEKDLPNVARCEKLLGDIAAQAADLRAAEAHWSRAAGLFERSLMVKLAAGAVEALAQLAASEGRAAEAADFREQAARLRGEPSSA